MPFDAPVTTATFPLSFAILHPFSRSRYGFYISMNI
jgi:hypothetical protein